MKRYLKYTIICAFLVIAVQYWVLAIISEWLICDSSAVVYEFNKAHPLIACMAGFIWVADEFLGRYLVILFLMIIAWWVIKKKIHEPPV